jgi:transglutaminase-like putative cysteine protease
MRPAIELLEDRMMLDSGGLPAALVVGRTLATPSTAASATPAPSYFVGEVANNQVTITYTVYNEQADPETGVLLTDTLAPGVTMASAAQQPDQSGQNLAWSLGTIQGYDRASVSITVNLPNASTLQLDTGASAYATLDAGAVSASTPAATLRAGNVSDPSLLASTPDANTTDPFIQEEAAKLGYDPTQIFNFLHTQLGYNSYTGSLRGARGTLWSKAGNALDVASLGVALMRASGIPAQYVQGTLSYSQAQTLILSMFPASYQTVGYIPSGTQTADPANDPQLQSETQNHYWFQFDAGSGMTDADPLMAGAKIGQTFTTSTGTFAQVADALREKTEIQLNAEIYSQASAAFGLGDGLSTTTVLDQTFNDVDLVGRPLTIGNFVSTSSTGFLLNATTNTYTPYIELGDEAFPDPSQDETITGKPYQEVLTNFPLGSQVLTSFILDVTLSGPNNSQQTYDRTLLDRIGIAARQGLVHANPSIDPSGPPAFTDFDLFTLNALPALENPAPPVALEALVTKQQQHLAAMQNSDGSFPLEAKPLLLKFIDEFDRLEGTDFLQLSDQSTARLESVSRIKAYFDQPRLVIVSSQMRHDASNLSMGLSQSINLQRETVRAIAYPGQLASAAFVFNTDRGIVENVDETEVMQSTLPSGQSQVIISTETVFQAAKAQGIALVIIGNEGDLQRLDASAETKARMSLALQNNQFIVAPSRPVTIDGIQTTAWYQIDGQTGESIGVTEDGGHQAITEYAVTLGLYAFTLGVVYQLFIVVAIPHNQRSQWKGNAEAIEDILTGVSAAGAAADRAARRSGPHPGLRSGRLLPLARCPTRHFRPLRRHGFHSGLGRGTRQCGGRHRHCRKRADHRGLRRELVDLQHIERADGSCDQHKRRHDQGRDGRDRGHGFR